MKNTLTPKLKRLLELEHRYESEARICDRIKRIVNRLKN